MKIKLTNCGALLFAMLLTNTEQLMSQGAPLPTIQWQKSFGGSCGDFLYSLKQTSDGGYILGGWSYPNTCGISTNKTSADYGMEDYWVIKLDGSGNKIWDRSFGGSSYDILYSLQKTSDGGYILGGYSASDISGNKTSVNHGLEDYWVVKLDANGNKLWDRSFGGSDGDVLNSLKQTSDGGYILGGNSGSGISGDKTSTNYGNYDYWVVKIDGNGNKLWDRSFGGSEWDSLSSLEQTSDGGYILGGWSSSNISGNKTSVRHSSKDYWVIRLDGNGNKVWEKSFGGGFLNSLQQTSDKGYILGGYSISVISSDKTSPGYGGTDYWIIKLDSNGNKVWDRSFGGSDNDYLNSLQQTSDGGYILGGYSASGISGNKTSVNYGSSDYWVIKIDANGNKIWDQSFGGSYNDELIDLQQTSDGGYILGGFSWFTNSSYSSYDYLVIKINDWVTPLANVPTTIQETYSCPITRQPGKDSLVIVTHGWIPKKDGDTVPPNLDWVDETANLIRTNIASRGLNNWQVETFKWKEKAWMKLPTDQLLDNGEKEGGNLGDCVGSQGWSHIHLIGHSAGAAVIQAATLNIKCANVNTVVHTTFLDPYVGFTYGGRSRYGLVADWADNYFAWDLTTYDHLFFGRTASKLDHAYNIDVGWLDPNKVSLGRYRSTATGGIEECFETVTSHEWPHDFYMNTILPNAQPDSQGFGFPFSKEGGNWNFARANYSIYTDPTRVLGTPDEPCPLMPDYSIPVYPLWLMNFNQTPSVTSTTGFIENNGSLFILSGTGASQLPQLRQSGASIADASGASSTPAWLATVLTVTNKINFVSFDAQFSSTNGAEGILSVYWNTNSIGTIDERVVVPGLRHYTYSFQTVTNGTHTLGFRLDSFTTVTSSITVTNVALSFVGIPDPFSLSFTGKETNGCSLFRLTGPSGFNYLVEASTNLIDWKTMAILVNTNGTVSFVDHESTNSTAKFYRTVGY